MTDSKEMALFGSKQTLPAHMQAAAAKGNENVNSEDVVIPRLKLLQKISAEVDEGAPAEQYYNTVSGISYIEPYVVNLHYKKEYAVFKDRKLGNEFQGTFQSEEAAQNHIDTLDRPDDYNINVTGVHTLLLLDDEGQPLTPIMYNMSNTAFRVSQTWNSQYVSGEASKGPRYGSVWQLGTKDMRNNMGSWVVPDPTFVGWADEALFKQIEKFVESTKAA